MSSPAAGLAPPFLAQLTEAAEMNQPGQCGLGSPVSSSFLDQLRQRLRSDEELVEQLQQGHADALTVLFGRHSRVAFHIARRVLRNDAEAEDVVQQIFLDVYRSIRQFDPAKGAFKPWLLTVTYHRAFSRRRALLSARYFSSDPLDDLLPEMLTPTKRTGSEPEQRILLDQVLSALEPRQRRTIELTYYEGLTADEIARSTGETVRVVRHNLYRGLEKLREAILKPAPRAAKPQAGEGSSR